MQKELFLGIVNTLSARYEYFQLRTDAACRISLSPLQKCMIVVRQLAYGGTADMFDEYLQVGESIGRERLKNFCQGVRETFRDTYMQKPTVADCQFLLDLHGRTHNFPGMLGSIDCMHWEWTNCPTAWRGQYTTGFKGTHPTIILEAIANQRLWIWHSYFGVVGSNNDLNVVQSSPLFNQQCKGYYLADGIYPSWPVVLNTIRCPTSRKMAYFTEKQEAARKDVERAFGSKMKVKESQTSSMKTLLDQATVLQASFIVRVYHTTMMNVFRHLLTCAKPKPIMHSNVI
ncbi:uncharacterized protein LOC121779977 [Salvia splendens]|uniref:uncharacterized protein LOC121779977 n=1 Tax=Salvia splendens TaxID=180675 RepID=UPI001C27248B|nr:uncharacterized protein LOC121779977 [Salvia splendens]